MIKRPLKAPNESLEDSKLHLLPYPVVGSAKIDGFRCTIDGIPKTSSMKPQPNPFVQSELSLPELNGLDGELVLGKPNSPEAFNTSTGPLRRGYGEPDFTFYVFDRFIHINMSYSHRWLLYMENCPFHPRIIVLPQEILYSPAEVIAFTNACVEQGFEGAMIRSLEGKYKQGRATFNEMNIFKRKPLADTEATIIGFNEQMTNLNPEETNEMGLTKRASNKENKVPAGTLGSFVLQSPLWKDSFKCGGGKLNHEERKAIWNMQESFLGKKVTFKYQPYGSVLAPRQPIFKCFYTKANMKEIQLTQGKVALVDDEDYIELNKFNWYAYKGGKTYYAQRRVPNTKEKKISMHYTIIGTKIGYIIDHKDRNGLNNQRYNLRFCTNSQNQCNKGKHILNSSSNYKGVFYRKDSNKWRAVINVNYKRINLGSFDYEGQAAMMYNIAAIKYHGEFAYFNKLPKEFEEQFKEVLKLIAPATTYLFKIL